MLTNFVSLSENWTGLSAGPSGRSDRAVVSMPRGDSASGGAGAPSTLHCSRGHSPPTGRQGWGWCRGCWLQTLRVVNTSLPSGPSPSLPPFICSFFQPISVECPPCPKVSAWYRDTQMDQASCWSHSLTEAIAGPDDVVGGQGVQSETPRARNKVSLPVTLISTLGCLEPDED